MFYMLIFLGILALVLLIGIISYVSFLFNTGGTLLILWGISLAAMVILPIIVKIITSRLNASYNRKRDSVHKKYAKELERAKAADDKEKERYRSEILAHKIEEREKQYNTEIAHWENTARQNRAKIRHLNIVSPDDQERPERIERIIELFEKKRASSISEAYAIMDAQDKALVKQWLNDIDRSIEQEQTRQYREKMLEEAERTRRAEEKRASEAEKARKDIEDMRREYERDKRGW